MGPGRREQLSAPGGADGTGPAPAAGPVRTCIGCRRRAGVDELVRVTAGPDGRLVVGRSAPGRGAWLCAGGRGCFQLAARRRAFGRALRRPVAGSAVADLAARMGLDGVGGPASGDVVAGPSPT